MILAAIIVAAGAYLVSSEAVVPNKAKEMAASAKATAAKAVTKAKDVAKTSTEAVKTAAKDMAAAAKEKTADVADKVAEKAAEAKKMVVAEADTDAPKAVGNNVEGKEYEDGKWVDADGMPTYNIDGDGQVIKQVDWFTYSGWRRYHAECHVCHGPNGDGSTFAPALADSLKKMPYETFLQVVSSGQRNKWGRDNSVMPALGDNKNVMCYVDDIYIYLRARAEGAMPPGKLSAGQRAAKPEEAKEFENECFDG